MKSPSDDNELGRGFLLLPIDPREWGRRMLRLRVLVRESVEESVGVSVREVWMMAWVFIQDGAPYMGSEWL